MTGVRHTDPSDGPSSAVEDYVKAIYSLQARGAGPVSTGHWRAGLT